MNGSLSALAALILAASGMLAQSPAARPKFDDFEVATIRPTAPDGGKFITMQSTHQFVAKNLGTEDARRGRIQSNSAGDFRRTSIG